MSGFNVWKDKPVDDGAGDMIEPGQKRKTKFEAYWVKTDELPEATRKMNCGCIYLACGEFFSRVIDIKIKGDKTLVVVEMDTDDHPFITNQWKEHFHKDNEE